MRNSLLMKHMVFVYAILLSTIVPLYGDKVWSNNPSITEPSAFAPVINENLLIDGTNFLDDHIHIIADTSDVIVSVNTPSVVTGDNPNAALHIFAAADRTVTFNVEQDLIFRGSIEDLLITFSGAGNLVFQVAGNANLEFTSLPTTGGTIFVINMDNITNTPNPEDVLFKRFPLGSLGAAEQDLNANVTIGPKSVISFIAPSIADGGTGTEQAVVAFDPTNTTDHVGRLVFSLQDNAGMLIYGNQNTAPSGIGFADINITDIDFTTRAGGTANMRILTQDPVNDWAGLLVVNGNMTWSRLQSNPWCELTPLTIQTGFVLGQNGLLNTTNGTYLDYVGTVTNYTIYPTVDPAIIEARELEGFPISTYVKDRNTSAFIVDGEDNPFAVTKAQIVMEGRSAVYFRSGVDHDGVSIPQVLDPATGDLITSFTINPIEQEKGAAGYGEIVFDVEGPLNVFGDITRQTALNVLSLYVTPTGGSVLIEDTDTIFPLRTFQKDEEGQLLQYNSASFMINNRMQMFSTNLQHTDALHNIYEKNFPLQSEATYIGGESWKLCEDRPRPNFVLYDSQLLMHTSGAFTGVDILTPEEGSDGNLSNIVFYYNGRVIDNGTGRSLILGTDIGALASDLNTIINRDAHLDIYQEFSIAPATPQILSLLVAPNNNKVTEGAPINQNDILDQFSVHNIFLGHASNISIGTDGELGVQPDNGTTFELTTVPTLFINGDFIAFETQGGDISIPESSVETGEGGMFVDHQGVVQIAADKRASVALMVVKSRNGIIDLPKRQVFFDLRIGIAHWLLNLSDPTQREIIAANQSLSDYTLDWSNVTKDYASLDPFIPINTPNTPAVCECPPVTSANLRALPTIRGIVDQFQIQNSRLGDQAHVMVDGGLVREFVMRTGEGPGVAPVGILALQNNANVGLGTAHRNVDSDEAQVVLGVNGIGIVANGSAQVILNEDTMINNVCHILTGPDFGLEDKDQLYFSSVVPRELRIKNEGVLDLSMFMNENQELIIGGQITLVLEPGARVIMGGGLLRFADQARVVFQPFIDEDLPVGTDLTSTDPFRVKLSGSGRLIMSEDSQMLLLRDAFVGIESAGFLAIEDTSSIIQTSTLMNCSYITSFTWQMRDAAKIFIGNDSDFGGALQIGNTTDMSLIDPSARVDFTLIIDGTANVFEVNSQGFLGLGAGIVSKPESAISDPFTPWRIDRTFNVANIAINIAEGTVKHNQILPTTHKLAGLIAIGRSNSFNLQFDVADVDVLGGGNMVLVNNGPITPTVTTIDGAVNPNYSAGLMVSLAHLTDPSKQVAPPSPIQPAILGSLYVLPTMTPSQFFNYLKINPYGIQATKRASIFQNSLGSSTIGYVDGFAIIREVITGVIGTTGTWTDIQNSLEIGAVSIALDGVGIPTAYAITTNS